MKRPAIVLLTAVFLCAVGIFVIIFKTSDEKFENMASTAPAPEQEAPVSAIKETAPSFQNTPVTATYLMGKFDPSKMENFILVAKSYAMPGYSGLYLRKETYDAFVKMSDQAKKDGVTLKIISATRNFDTQKGIWNAKWNLYHDVTKILAYSAMPGTSRHHWGTDFDINSVDPAYFNTAIGKKEYDWLSENAKNFGFCQPYSPKGDSRKTGYNEEKWHWSYVPLSKVFTESYKNTVQVIDLTGFSGSDKISGIDVVKDYVLGISPDCL